MGVFNSFLFPNFVSIMSNWFSRKNRGFLIGLWATANNVGNIVGIQLSAGLLTAFDNRWEFLLMIVSVTQFLMAIVLAIFLVPEPSHLGITIDDLTEDA